MSKIMASPDNGVYIVMGELSFVVTAMKKGNRWSSHMYQDEHQDNLIRNFSNLKDVLNHVSDLSELDPYTFLSPFLDVIRSEDTTGPVTGLALSSINKFLAYNLISIACEAAPVAVENIADAVTHARFVGTDPGSDEVVLIKILHVLRTLLLTPIGSLLTNESVCEIMQSCFRICFEMRLSELLRKSAEHSLMDMVQLLFSRLPQFSEDISKPGYFSSMNKKFKMRTGSGLDTSARNHRRRRNAKDPYKKTSNRMDLPVTSNSSESSNTNENKLPNVPALPTPPESCTASPIDPTAASQTTCKAISSSSDDQTDKTGENADSNENVSAKKINVDNMTISASDLSQNDATSELTEASSDIGSVEVIDDLQSFPSMTDMSVISGNSVMKETEYVNTQGVRFTPSQQGKNGTNSLMPYGLPCVRELFRFLISLTNPFEKHNTDVMVQIGLTLLTVALESGADHASNFNSLLLLVQDDMCRNLFSLLNSERLSVFAATLRASFLLFESMRTKLKLQLEMYLKRLMSIVVSESQKVSYEQREIALDSVVQLWRIPGLVTELYLNYDCDLYCSNLFENLTKLLSKNAFPVSGLYSTHLLSLDALLTVVDCIEEHCHSRILHDNQLTKMPVPTESAASNSEGSEKSVSTATTDPAFGNHNVTVLQASGYQIASYLKGLSSTDASTKESASAKTEQIKIEHGIRHSRMKISENIPSHETLMAIKHRKKLLATGTEQFNSKPSKGIAFLQENGLLTTPLNPNEVAVFLKENPKLDKKMIGEYISNKKNQTVMEAFVKSFSFESTRVDEALRMYLEVFRLSGEAPVISLLLEQFADHWHKSNQEPFSNSDAAFTLAYAIIMLNVDQHNHNVKKQNTPMTLEEFKKNLSKVNGGQDFNEEMLEDIYYSIRNEEIIMPAEQTGLVKENYLWKLILKRGTTKDGVFVHAPNGLYDHDLFSLIWGPTVAALSFVFDKSNHDASITQCAISGFRKCAMISAHYGMSDVFDNLIISLLKFTTLLSSAESPEYLAISFGNNFKAQLAAKTVFNLAHRHGDILREGWKNILDCVLQLFKAKLLPKPMVEAEDFVHPRGIISLIREEIPAQRAESGLLSSFYSYITQTSDTQAHKGLSPEDEMAMESSEKCISDCHPDQLITESKFLRIDSLQELVKAIIFASHGPDAHVSTCGGYDEESTVFFLELLIKIVIQNRDRVGGFWSSIRDHIYSLVMSAGASDHFFLMERAIVGILRLAIRLLRKEEMTPQVLQSLRMLLLLKPHTLLRVSRQVSFALHELLRTNAANIHNSQDWSTLFTLLECVGAGSKPPKVVNSSSNSENENYAPSFPEPCKRQSDSEMNSTFDSLDRDKGIARGYTSDGELYNMDSHYQYSFTDKKSTPSTKQLNPNSPGGWILVGKEGEIESVTMKAAAARQYKMTMNCDLMPHDTRAFMKSSESLAFLVRDVAHITPENFELCVRCIQTFVEASMNGGRANSERRNSMKFKDRKINRKKKQTNSEIHRSPSSPQINYHADDEGDDEEEPPGGYHQISLQLLDLMHTLHTRAASIFSSWAAEQTSESSVDTTADSLWTKCWCPLLQGIAKLCCDARRQVRISAINYLQRALLFHDLQTLSAVEWEACFNEVLFPLLAKLLENVNNQDPIGMEDTRVRGATLLSKVFLQHFTPLLSLPTFTALWLTILDFMDKYMHAEKSEDLFEAIPEKLKNMLLVMDTAGVFQPSEPGNPSPLWSITADRIDAFVPGLSSEVVRPQQNVLADSTTQEQSELPADVTSATLDASVESGTPGVQDPSQEPGNSNVTDHFDVQATDVIDAASRADPPPDSASAIEESVCSNTAAKSASPLIMEPTFGPHSVGTHPSVILHSPLPSVLSLSPVQLHHHAVNTPAVPIILGAMPEIPSTTVNLFTDEDPASESPCDSSEVLSSN